MNFFTRNIIVCKIKNLSNQYNASFCYIPEIGKIQFIASTLLARTLPLTSSLQTKLTLLNFYKETYGYSLLPFKKRQGKVFTEELFNDLLQNNIPLPANIYQFELQYYLPPDEDNIFIYEEKIKIQTENLTFFAKYFPLVGTFATLILTLGFTISSLTTMAKWGWSLFLFFVFGLSKFLTTYADIAGGPERRLQMLGFWLDRIIRHAYAPYNKFSLWLGLLNLLVVGILICSSILTWYGAWQMIRCMSGMSYFPGIVASLFAGAFAWSSAGSSFGRIYMVLYQLLYDAISPWVSLDNVRQEEKLTLTLFSTKLAVLCPHRLPSPAPTLLLCYPQHSSPTASLCKQSMPSQAPAPYQPLKP